MLGLGDEDAPEPVLVGDLELVEPLEVEAHGAARPVDLERQSVDVAGREAGRLERAHRALAEAQRGGHGVVDRTALDEALLEAGDNQQATIPLSRARDLDPDKTSIREALGRAYFRSGRFGPAAEEFEEVVERAPVNDFAHFCLGKALVKTGRLREARRHAVLAASMRPDRADYCNLRDRLSDPAA